VLIHESCSTLQCDKNTSNPLKKIQDTEKISLRIWIISLSIDFCTKPAASINPMPLGGGMGDIQDLSSLWYG